MLYWKSLKKEKQEAKERLQKAIDAFKGTPPSKIVELIEASKYFLK